MIAVYREIIINFSKTSFFVFMAKFIVVAVFIAKFITVAVWFISKHMTLLKLCIGLKFF